MKVVLRPHLSNSPCPEKVKELITNNSYLTVYYYNTHQGEGKGHARTDDEKGDVSLIKQ
jgi:hypothetical protein